MVMSHVLSKDGVDWELALPTAEVVSIKYREIRREHSGVHALVAILHQGRILGYDTFNIGRREDRQRLGNAAYKMISSPLTKEAMKDRDLLHHLDVSALQTPGIWEEERISIVSYTTEADPGPVEFVLKPYIIRGGGTICYAPPKSGKSYLMQAWAITIATGKDTIWSSNEFEPVLYVNLERDGSGFLRRELALKRAFGITVPTGVHYLHARGMGLAPLRRKIREWLSAHPQSGVILDSISRSQVGGSLNEDEAGNHFIDMMNGLNPPWWAAVAHTPRASADHIFGSVMFDAGMDIGVKVSHERRGNLLGIRLEITDANDIGNFAPEYIALEFDADDSPVARIRKAQDTDFPELAATGHISQVEKIKLAIDNSERANMTTAELAKATGLDQGNISRVLKGKDFIALPRDGKRGVPYGIRSEIR